jgi:hypothetical protein
MLALLPFTRLSVPHVTLSLSLSLSVLSLLYNIFLFSLSLSFVVQCVTFGWDDLTLDLAFPQFMDTSLAINFVGKDVCVIYWGMS